MKLMRPLVSIAILFCLSVSLTCGGLVAAAPRQQRQPTKPKPSVPAKSDVAQDPDGRDIVLHTELVDIAFTVLDDRNTLASTLKKEEIEVLEDGVPQEVKFFDRNNNVPVIAALLIDVSSSQEFILPEEKDAAEGFFQSAFRPGKDYGAIVTFRGETQLVQGLTSNIDRLTRALRLLKRDLVFRGDEGLQSGGTSLYEAISLTSNEVLQDKTARRITENDDQTRFVIRRAMIVLTDGKDTTSQLKLKDAIERANRAGTLIYPIGIGDNFRFGDVDRKVLEQLAHETGGRAYFPRDEADLRAAFKQIQAELSSQYVVGFEPTNSAKDGTFRKVEIHLKDHGGWQVVHKSGYFAVKQQ